MFLAFLISGSVFDFWLSLFHDGSVSWLWYSASTAPMVAAIATMIYVLNAILTTNYLDVRNLYKRSF